MDIFFIITSVLKIAVLLGVILFMVSYTVYAERRVSAFIQDRVGPNRVGPAGLFQPIADMFHLFTHAFFKALLFLAAGSIIVMLHHEQNIWKMGGLRKRLPITFATFGAGALALIGCPPFSGFFSKDAILAVAYEHNLPIFALALFTAFLTAFYVIRMGS